LREGFITAAALAAMTDLGVKKLKVMVVMMGNSGRNHG